MKVKHGILKGLGSILLIFTIFVPFICVATPMGSTMSVKFYYPFEFFTEQYANVVAFTYLFAVVAYVLCLHFITNRWGMLASTLPLLSVNLLFVCACCGLFSYNNLRCIMQYIGVFAIYVYNYAVIGACHVDMGGQGK